LTSVKYFLPFPKVPNDVNIAAELIGGENRTISMAAQDSSDFNLDMPESDILVFSNTTSINVTWYQNNDMDIVDYYILSVQVSKGTF